MYAGMWLDGLLVFLSFARGKQIRRVIGTWLRVWNVKRVAFLLFALALLRQRARACEALPNVCFGRIESFSGWEERMLVWFAELRTHQTTSSGVSFGRYYDNCRQIILGNCPSSWRIGLCVRNAVILSRCNNLVLCFLRSFVVLNGHAQNCCKVANCWFQTDRR